MKTEAENVDGKISKVLLRFPEIKLAILFGSAGRGNLRADSDVDLAVAADYPLTAETRFCLIGDLASETGRAVDLIDLVTTNGPILAEVLRGRVIRQEDPAIFARLMRRVWHWEADLAPTWRAAVKARNARIFNEC